MPALGIELSRAVAPVLTLENVAFEVSHPSGLPLPTNDDVTAPDSQAELAMLALTL